MALHDDFTRSTVTVPKATLLAAIQANRTKHAESYAAAMIAYRKAYTDEVHAHFITATQGGKIERALECAEPEEHLDEYDLVIEMLEMSTSDTVTISSPQFKNFVKDEWNWTSSFLSNTMSYSSRK